MPVEKYFGGHGKEVMKDMRKRYGKRAEEVFYATANKRKMVPKSNMPKGAGMTPSGDIGAKRQAEAKRVGNKFKSSKTVTTAGKFGK